MITKNDIKNLAPIFQNLNKPHEIPTVQYDCMSGALFWRDELPDLADFKPSLWWNIRPVLAYRTSRAMKEPRVEYLELWETAELYFPNWVGFRPKRCQWDERIEKIYRNRSSEQSPGY